MITHPHIVFRTSESKAIFTIKPDGSVELGEGASMDEASAAFWDYVMKHRPANTVEAKYTQEDMERYGKCYADARDKRRADTAGAIPAMPPTDDRRPDSEDQPDGYLESDNEWLTRNLSALRWLIDNHATIRAALAAPPAPSVTPDEYAQYYHGARLNGLKPYTFDEYVQAASKKEKT